MSFRIAEPAAVSAAAASTAAVTLVLVITAAGVAAATAALLPALFRGTRVSFRITEPAAVSAAAATAAAVALILVITAAGVATATAALLPALVRGARVPLRIAIPAAAAATAVAAAIAFVIFVIARVVAALSAALLAGEESSLLIAIRSVPFHLTLRCVTANSSQTQGTHWQGPHSPGLSLCHEFLPACLEALSELRHIDPGLVGLGENAITRTLLFGDVVLDAVREHLHLRVVVLLLGPPAHQLPDQDLRAIVLDLSFIHCRVLDALLAARGIENFLFDRGVHIQFSADLLRQLRLLPRIACLLVLLEQQLHLAMIRCQERHGVLTLSRPCGSGGRSLLLRL